jgi:galactose mutarotase-like enzyme
MWEWLEQKPQMVRPFRGPGGLDMFRLSAGDAVAEVAPSRGGLVTRFAIGDDELLYLDPATLADRKQNVRGGIPVLFPVAGRLSGDRYTLPGGASFPMRQHGLARHAAWEVTHIVQARLTMQLTSSSTSRGTFPFDFAFRVTVDLGRAGYRSMAIEVEAENRGPQPMPLHCGFHPYFQVPEIQKGELRVDVEATSAYDNQTGQTGPYPRPIDFTATEVDLHLGGLKARRATLHVPGKPPRLLTFSDLFSTVVLWTTTLKDFVCVEPWTAPADALNTGVGLTTLKPGEIRKGEFVISA